MTKRRNYSVVPWAITLLSRIHGGRVQCAGDTWLSGRSCRGGLGGGPRLIKQWKARLRASRRLPPHRTDRPMPPCNRGLSPPASK